MKRCEELMTRDLRWTYTDATVMEAAALMRDCGIGFLPVCDRSTARVVGVLTDRDIAVRLCASDGKASQVKTVDIATPGPVVCAASDDVTRAEELMQAHDIERILVVDEHERLMGVLSLTNILMQEPSWRALKTARKVLEREVMGPHVPVESVHLTKSTSDGVEPTGEPSAEEIRSTSGPARDRVDAIVGGETRDIRTFPG